MTNPYNLASFSKDRNIRGFFDHFILRRTTYLDFKIVKSFDEAAESYGNSIFCVVSRKMYEYLTRKTKLDRFDMT